MGASWQAFYAHLCAASIIRAMPETEIPPAMRGDLYSSFIGLIADNRNLFYLSSNGSSFQSKDHIRGAFEKAFVLFPAHAAFAMLQAYELLLHLSAAVRADLITVSHIIQPALIYIGCGWTP